MRKIKIVKVNGGPGVPGSIEVDGDYTSIFNGRFYRNGAGDTLPAYTNPAPPGYVLIATTSFNVIENEKYRGRYTVYTSTNSSDAPSAVFESGKTTIRVNELMRELADGEPLTLLTDGYITNISTYLLDTGTETIIVSPNVDITTYPIEFVGREFVGWGEIVTQNFLNLARNFADAVPPANGFVGQTWYDTDNKQLRIWDGNGWDLLNRTAYGVTFQHTQGVPATEWTISHLLDIPAPHIAFVQFFVDRGEGPKLILPAEVSFDSANQLTAFFSNPEMGYVLVRQ